MRFLYNLSTTAPPAIFRPLACALIILMILISPGFSASAAAAAKGEALVQKGIDQYNNGHLDQALATLQEAGKIFPESIAVPYYAGLICLKTGDRGQAIAHWRRYVAMVPGDENTMELRKQITLLLRNEARDYAQKAVAQQNDLLSRPVDDDTVAVTAYKNLGSESLAPLGKGMAAMIIADLSLFKGLEVVEREKLQALLAELELGTSGLVDEKEAPKVGRLLRAKYVAGGSLADPRTETLEIASVLFDAGQNTSAGEKAVSGRLAEFYELEKEIACGIADDLGRSCAKAPKGFDRIHTKSLPALEAYAYGLDYLDEEKYDEARAMFQKAVEEDPQFDLAHAALIATPVAAMLLLTEAQIISSASAGAPGATATGSAAAVSAGAGGTGIGTTAAVAGGVAVAGGAAAAVAAGMDEDNGDDNEQMDLNGQWRGTWNDQSDQNGDFVLQLTQDGENLAGEATITGTDCISTASIDGSCGGGRINLNLTAGETVATLTAQTTSENEMTGDLEFTAGDCAGSDVQVSAQKTGGAIIEW